jgi:hypothetical protein
MEDARLKMTNFYDRSSSEQFKFISDYGDTIEVVDEQLSSLKVPSLNENPLIGLYDECKYNSKYLELLQKYDLDGITLQDSINLLTDASEQLQDTHRN